MKPVVMTILSPTPAAQVLAAGIVFIVLIIIGCAAYKCSKKKEKQMEVDNNPVFGCSEKKTKDRRADMILLIIMSTMSNRYF